MMSEDCLKGLRLRVWSSQGFLHFEVHRPKWGLKNTQKEAPAAKGIWCHGGFVHNYKAPALQHLDWLLPVAGSWSNKASAENERGLRLPPSFQGDSGRDLCNGEPWLTAILLPHAEHFWEECVEIFIFYILRYSLNIYKLKTAIELLIVIFRAALQWSIRQTLEPADQQALLIMLRWEVNWKHLSLGSLKYMEWSLWDESICETEFTGVWQKKQQQKVKKKKSGITLSASVHWCGSQTPKETPPVPGYKHNWLCGCLEAAQLSPGRIKYSWRFACIHYLSCGKTAWVLLGKLFPQF